MNAFGIGAYPPLMPGMVNMLGMPGMFPTNQIGSLPGQAQVQGLNRNQSGSTNNNIE